MANKIKDFFVRYYEALSSMVFRSKSGGVFEGVISDRLRSKGNEPVAKILEDLKTAPEGLSDEEAALRQEQFGFNEIVHERRDSWPVRLLKNFGNPLAILLIVLSVVSILTSDIVTAAIIFVMVLIGVFLRFYQENQSYNAAEKLRAMVKTTCTVVRQGKPREIELKELVVGDIVQLAAGDIVPADLRLVTSKELFVNQATLTGEAMPQEKHGNVPAEGIRNPLEFPSLCFTGTDVGSGAARAVVIATGSDTYFGKIAKSVMGQRVVTSFDKGIDEFAWLMFKFMLVMAPTVFLINGIFKHNWWEAFFFAIAVAVGLTPELLPALVTVNLSKGAISMSKKKVIVKRLNSIQNFGAMNILCTDKTGTLTQNKIVLIENIDLDRKEEMKILELAYLNSFYQTGFRNLMDDAVLKRGEKKKLQGLAQGYEKVDELPFDFGRKRLSVVIKVQNGDNLFICKGAVEEVVNICKFCEVNGKAEAMTQKIAMKALELNRDFSKRGYRVLAVAYKNTGSEQQYYTAKDEQNLILLGFMTFFDPPKESAAPALAKLKTYGVAVKVLTGDNELVTKKICKEVGLEVMGIMLGGEVEGMSQTELEAEVDKKTIFAKLSPDHKKRVVEALQKNGHVVGYLGDGINDAPALRAADVGISVDSAVDIAKESADIILLELSLLVLEEGVIEGRKVFGNIIKYIKMGASSNFGNMFSVLGASIFLPFLPMAPLQLLTNNLLYDISQTAIPTDGVDEEYLEKPRKWEIGDIKRFMFYIGPISSVFDYTTFFMMLFIFHAWDKPLLFQTGWFVESILTQTLIVHVIRSRKMAFVQTWASKTLIFTTFGVMAAAVWLVYSPFAKYLNFVHLPGFYWPLVVLTLAAYVCLVQLVKTWYIKKFGYN